MTNNEYLQQQYREDMRSRNWISFNDWVAQQNPPPQRTWVGLSDAEIKKIVGSDRYTDLLLEVVNFVEAKLKEKNI